MRVPIRNLLQLNQGSVVELERGAGESLDVFVNGTLIAHGEVVVINDRFGVRLTDVVSPSERISGDCVEPAAGHRPGRRRDGPGPSAGDAGRPARGHRAPGLFGAVMALLAVLALIVGLGWLLKRMPGSGFRPTGG